jgi:hypothetical protein
MKSIILTSSFVALLLLSACTSTYGPTSNSFWNGKEGYLEIPLDANTYRVSFVGGPDELVDRYDLYRCAELTIAKGFDHFVIINSSYSGVTRSSEAVAINIIRMFKGMPPQNELMAFDAKAMISGMAQFITRDTTK